MYFRVKKLSGVIHHSRRANRIVCRLRSRIRHFFFFYTIVTIRLGRMQINARGGSATEPIRIPSVRGDGRQKPRPGLRRREKIRRACGVRGRCKRNIAAMVSLRGGRGTGRPPWGSGAKKNGRRRRREKRRKNKNRL